MQSPQKLVKNPSTFRQIFSERSPPHFLFNPDEEWMPSSCLQPQLAQHSHGRLEIQYNDLAYIFRMIRRMNKSTPLDLQDAFKKIII
ncbi:hypothetical protein AYI69_g6523 [Smittium culicis]|uniref:Uncharacterized protein n=1 Tax=Smittium culicis TaxID=133412 RepID=A0A1R1XYD4_9FUNG|nr:hypothetical protein AYI69_g6523 [Smittium culicis]